MKKQTQLLLLPFALATACATMAGSKTGSSAPFQGADKVTKRRTEIANAGSAAIQCMKAKSDSPVKGGVFAVVADASGKLKIDTLKWDGPDAIKQCIVDSAGKATISALPGPSVGTLWEFSPPGDKSDAPKAPDDLAVKMQPLSQTMQAAVVQCGQSILGVDFGATIEVSYFLYNDGHAYAPTVISSDAKDGSFDSCVQDVITKTPFPALSVDKPFGTTSRFKIGQYGDTQHQ